MHTFHFGDRMFLFGSDMLGFGNTMSLFGNDMFLLRNNVILAGNTMFRLGCGLFVFWHDLVLFGNRICLSGDVVLEEKSSDWQATEANSTGLRTGCVGGISFTHCGPKHVTNTAVPGRNHGAFGGLIPGIVSATR